jgi:hypothetical protein
MDSSSSGLLQNIRAFGNNDGIQVNGQYSVVNAQANNNESDGIVVEFESSGSIIGSTANFNGGDGIDVSTRAMLVVFNTEAIGNGGLSSTGDGLKVIVSEIEATVAQSLFCDNRLDVNSGSGLTGQGLTCDTSSIAGVCDCPCSSGKGKGGKKGGSTLPSVTTELADASIANASVAIGGQEEDEEENEED